MIRAQQDAEGFGQTAVRLPSARSGPLFGFFKVWPGILRFHITLCLTKNCLSFSSFLTSIDFSSLSLAYTLFFCLPLHFAHNQAFKLFSIDSINLCGHVQHVHSEHTRCDYIQCSQLQTCTQIHEHVRAVTQISGGLCRTHDLTFRCKAMEDGKQCSCKNIFEITHCRYCTAWWDGV